MRSSPAATVDDLAAGSPAEAEPRWHRLTAQDLLGRLGTDATRGLTAAVAASRLRVVGPNSLPERPSPSAWTLFARQFRSPLVVVLLAALPVAAAVGESIDAAAIGAIVVLNATLGFVQEHRADRALAALRRMAVGRATVIRDGERLNVGTEDIVPGDLLVFDPGDAVAADARLVWTSGLRIEEAALTGESVPVTKTTEPITAEALADRHNMAFLGTHVSAGKGHGIVVSTGAGTELGRVAVLLGAADRDETPLERRLERLGMVLLRVALAAVGALLVLGLARGEAPGTMILTAVSLAVAAIPEGLPAIVTIALAMGVTRMARRHAIVRRLPAVETLGAATVICTDKTGTLTRGEMVVTRLLAGRARVRVTGEGYAPHGEFSTLPPDPHNPAAIRSLLSAAVLASDATLVRDGDAWMVVGDPTEGALVAAAGKAGLSTDVLETEWPRVVDVPFDGDRKRMTVVRRGRLGLTAFVKGAPEVLLERCSFVLGPGGLVEPLDQAWKRHVERANADFAREALRVLAVARREVGDSAGAADPEQLETALTWLGLVAMSDRPRPEAAPAIASCMSAGIRPVMITGDHRETGVAIAEEIGLETGPGAVMTGDEMDRLSDEELCGRVERVAVYARVSAEHKLRIVRAWRRLGAVVAMTGDGVNDAPALREADIGVAMGRTGTAVAREAADLVVTDDNFASIVAATAEGRRIYENIRKATTYLLSCNVSELLVMAIAIAGGLPLPLLPVQILWLNLLTDGLPALALTLEPAESDLMRRPPRPPRAEVLDGSRLITIGRHGLFMALGAFALFVGAERALGADLTRARTLIFTALVFSQLAHALNSRSESQSLASLGVRGNGLLFAAVLSGVALQWTVTAVPFLARGLGVVPLTLHDWGLAALTGALPLAGMEFEKAWRAWHDLPRATHREVNHGDNESGRVPRSQ
jgi:Ca2+-transporting ATPase